MDDRLILMGLIGRPHGVRGAVHVTTYSPDPEGLAELPLRDERGRRVGLAWTGAGIARVTIGEGDEAAAIADRDAAAKLTNLRLYVRRADLPPPEDEDEFYFADLIGLHAVGPDGAALGTIRAVHDFGAGASIELSDGSLLPFTRAVVPEIDLPGGRAVVVRPVEVEMRE